LALAAQKAGAYLRLGCSARFVANEADGFVVRLSKGEYARSTLAILANGRAGGGLGLAYGRRYLDDNVGVAARLSTVPRNFEPRTVIEALPNGWFYLAALPGNTAIAVFITSASIVPSGRDLRLSWWREALAETTIIRDAVRRCAPAEAVFVVDARGSYAQWCAGHRWLAIGDARIAPDPLSGQGIIWAVDDAVWIMQMMVRTDLNDISSEMLRRTEHDVATYLVERSRVYSTEQRFAAEPYWTNARSRVFAAESG
jgi:2-polyprenyl-6-methoxyphenol hydroxylase-like FAD-dependent oxidoreductase